MNTCNFLEKIRQITVLLDFLKTLYLPSLNNFSFRRPDKLCKDFVYFLYRGFDQRLENWQNCPQGKKKAVLLGFFIDICHVRSVFRTQSNICDETFLRQYLTAKSCQLSLQTSFIVDIRLGLNTLLQVLTYSSPPPCPHQK